MKNTYYLLLISLLLYSFSGCEKKCNQDEIEGNVEFYMLDTYETVDFSQEIVESSVVKEEVPLITYDQLIHYDPGDHAFEVADEVNGIINTAEQTLYGRAFGVFANNELVYTGYFWPGFFSSTCDWYVINPIFIDDENLMKVKIGYPGNNPDFVETDMRNDERILCIFERDGKLR